MKRKFWLTATAVLLIVLVPLLCLLGALLLQKPLVYFGVDGRFSGVVRRPLVGPAWEGSQADVYVGKERIFSLREGFWDDPVFIYPFSDGRRFLCDYDYDVAMLDFVVDFGESNADRSTPSDWPTNGQLRADLARMATNVVFDTIGVVRLPNEAELKEVSGYLTSTVPMPTEAGYFDFLNLSSKEWLLTDLATNRASYWPTGK